VPTASMTSTWSAVAGMKALFDGVYAPSTIGKLLREFAFGHARQLESVLSAAAMCCYG
jgi:hypothetical protein